MTSTGIRQGYSEGKPSSRVLKPPGGGGSNIFTPLAPVEVTPGKVNRMESNVFKEPESSPIPKSSKKEDTHNNLFGEERAKIKKDFNPATLKGQVHECLTWSVLENSTLLQPINENVVPPSSPLLSLSTNERVYRRRRYKWAGCPKSTHNPITGSAYGTNQDAIGETEKKGYFQDPIANKGGSAAEASEISHTRISQPPGGHCHKLW